MIISAEIRKAIEPFACPWCCRDFEAGSWKVILCDSFDEDNKKKYETCSECAAQITEVAFQAHRMAVNIRSNNALSKMP